MKKGEIYNYMIGVGLIVMLVIGTYFLPMIFSFQLDSQTIGKVTYLERDEFAFNTNLSVAPADRINTITGYVKQRGMASSIHLSDVQMESGGLMEDVREAVKLATAKGFLPTSVEEYISTEGEIMAYANYFYLDTMQQGFDEIALWEVTFTNYADVDIMLLLDASNLLIYYAECLYPFAIEDYIYTEMIGTSEKEYYKDKFAQYYETSEIESVLTAGGTQHCQLFKLNGYYLGWNYYSTVRWKNVVEGIIVGCDVFWNHYRGYTLPNSLEYLEETGGDVSSSVEFNGTIEQAVEESYEFNIK